MQLVLPAQMRQMDRQTIESVGIPGIVLMERAALGAVDTLYDVMPAEAGDAIGFMCGGGNNGGDGLAMARLVADDGYRPVVVLLSAADSLQGDARTNLSVLDALGIDTVDLSACAPADIGERLADLGACSVWCDALLGTGLDRQVEGRYAEAIDFLNEQACVVAVDIPSGIDAADGQRLGTSVRADATATFGRPKIGQALYPGRADCGRLDVVDIGLPAQVVDQVGGCAQWLDARWAAGRLARRPPAYHKGNSGKVLVLAGSHEKTGAALLAGRGALGSGAGLLSVGTHRRVVERIAPAIHEAMAAEMLADTADHNCQERLIDALDQVDAVGLGPAMGTSDGALEAVRAVLNSPVDNAVFDADALTVLAGRVDDAQFADFAGRAHAAVLTPHPAEMARLRGCSVAEITAGPVDHAADLADQSGAIVVLKTAATVVAGPDGRLGINASGNPGMSTGGVGDVLTGVITARLAESGDDDPFETVCTAVYVHGAAGDAAADHRGQHGMGATDLADYLAPTWDTLQP